MNATQRMELSLEKLVEPRGIEPLTFAMPLLEKLLRTLFFQAFLVRYQPERAENIGVLRYRCDTSLPLTEHAVNRLVPAESDSKDYVKLD